MGSASRIVNYTIVAILSMAIFDAARYPAHGWRMLRLRLKPRRLEFVMAERLHVVSAFLPMSGATRRCLKTGERR